MSTYNCLANATVAIECGTARGSGFHFIKPELIVTNYHVVQGHIDQGIPTYAITKDNHKFDLQLLGSSPADAFDFAIFRIDGKISEDRQFLTPKVVDKIEIGMELVFAGFPHGIPDLLVQRAIVAGFFDAEKFYIDGSVNGGNSGGPIVDLFDGSLVGIVTQRRFLGGPELDELKAAAKQIQDHCQRVASVGNVQIMGIDFGSFSSLMSDAMLLIKKVLEANANTGIGIGYSSKFVKDECEKLGY